ncbi:hypothetical protein ACCQ10_09260 [Xanthomonas sp. NCPPB 1325]|uniref:hypothetical protein n=1 Tax=Xanthomonas sp. NCPPB 1325 TaxID=487529 RepID=UPI003558E02F
MAKKNPAAYFPSVGTARICRRAVDKYAQRNSTWRPYFDTWQEAHAWLQRRAEEKLAKSFAAAAADRKHLARVLALKEPSTLPKVDTSLTPSQ